MVQITVKIEGMACGMCESHINDAVRRAFPVKKVTSSHKKGETVILTETEFSEEQLRAAIEPTGYRVLGVENEPYEKKRLFEIKNAYKSLGGEATFYDGMRNCWRSIRRSGRRRCGGAAGWSRGMDRHEGDTFLLFGPDGGAGGNAAGKRPPSQDHHRVHRLDR